MGDRTSHRFFEQGRRPRLHRVPSDLRMVPGRDCDDHRIDVPVTQQVMVGREHPRAGERLAESGPGFLGWIGSRLHPATPYPVERRRLVGSHSSGPNETDLDHKT